MNRRISMHEAAEAELNEAADFYDMESPGLGTVFIDEIQRVIENVTMFPEASQLLVGRIRRKLLPAFPYSLIYSVHSSEIRILAVAHQKRRPFYWRRRR
jgi:plasmid stabilization system protein ParE